MAELDLPEDYVDLLAELLRSEVEFVIVGGWAVAVHGHGRATDDLDILIRPTPENAARVIQALERFGAPLRQHGVSEGMFAQPRYGYRFGIKPILIEILTTVDGIDFDDAVADGITARIAGHEVPVIGRSALLANKRASGRHKDLADVEALELDD